MKLHKEMRTKEESEGKQSPTNGKLSLYYEENAKSSMNVEKKMNDLASKTVPDTADLLQTTISYTYPSNLTKKTSSPCQSEIPCQACMI